MAAGTSLSLADKTLTVTSDLSNSGTISASAPAGKLIMGGGSAQTISGTGTVKNLQISNTSGGVSIPSGAENKLYITGIFSQTTGVLTTNGNLVFRSTATEEGVVGAVGTCPTEPISGDVTVEKYIPAKRAFRFLSPGVASTTSINANWQEGSSVSVTTGYPYTSQGWQNPAPGYGTHITGGATNGLDATVTGNPSLFVFNVSSNAWVAVTNTFIRSFKTGEGYRIMVRGSRAVDLNDNAAAPSPTTLRTKGTMSVCESIEFTTITPVALNAAANGFSMVGNPYWSVVDWREVGKTDIESNLYYWDPTINGTNGRGAYVTVNNLGVNSVEGSNANQFIQPGQAFFVRNTATPTNPKLRFERADVVSEGGRTSIFRSAGSMGGLVVGQDAADAGSLQVSERIERIHLSLYLKDRIQSGPTDGALVTYRDDFTAAYGREDAAKLTNLDENIAADYGGRSHSILGLPGSGMRSDTIPLRMWNLYPSEYVLRVGLKSVEPDREVWLYDRSTGRSVQVTGEQLDHAFVQATGNARKEDLALVVHTRKPVANDDGSGRILLYPNPSMAAKVQVAVPMEGLKAEGGRLASTVDIIDLSGVLLSTSSLMLDGRGRGDLDVSGLGRGAYVLRVRVEGKTFTGKMIRQ